MCGLIGELAAAGTTVLLSSHDLAEVEQLCGAVTVLRTGAVVFSGSVVGLHERAGDNVHILTTSDDARAAEVAAGTSNVYATRQSAGLAVVGTRADIDRYVIALGQAGIAVRSLQLRERSLESVFLQLTGAGAGV